jgi:hypothetical protein
MRQRRMNLLMAYAAFASSKAEFTPLSLFAAGEQGVWYDPSDFSTMFQDDAGATPVTAVEQPVGRILDKSGRGNHATQATPASCPVLRARYNLLTQTEAFDNAAWTKGNSSVTANAATAPDGSLTADKLVENTANAQHFALQSTTVVTNTSYTAAIYLKAAERGFARLINYDGASTFYGVVVNLATGAVTTTVSGGTTSGNAHSVTSVGNGWWLVSVTSTMAGTGRQLYLNIGLDGTSTVTYLGDNTSGILVWGADLRAANDGVGLPVYQRVGAATDYATTGFPPYLAFDGTDDSLSTGSINFTATDKMSVFAGLRKLSDAAQGVVAELTASIAANNGAFLLSAPNSAAANYNFASKGTTQADNIVTTYTAPITNVITGLADISVPSNIIRANGSQVGSVGTTQGTGNYANAALNIGQRSGGTLRFNGRLYSLIILGRTATAAEIAQTETWVNGKTGAY